MADELKLSVNGSDVTVPSAPETPLLFIPPWIRSASSEFAITNKRVLIKVGLVRRHSLELLLQKVEGIGVDQSVMGRILGYGTITVSGVGGTKESFRMISDPLEFRRQVQASLSAVS